MSRNRTRGRRYDAGPKLNLKKVFGTIIAIIVFILMIISFIKLFKSDANNAVDTKKQYFAMYQNNKWGIIDSEGKKVIEPIYDEMFAIPDSSKDIFIYAYNINEETGEYKTRAINSKSEELFSNYDSVEAIENYDSKQNIWYEKEVLRVSKNGKYGLINLDGNEIMPCEYEQITALKGVPDNLKIQKEGKIGLANLTGQVIVQPKYKDILALKEDYKNEYIIVDEAGNQGIVSTSGNVLIEPKYNQIKYIDSGENFAVFDTTWKIQNIDGTVLLDAGYEEIGSIKGDNVIVKRDGKYGIATTLGEVKTENQYEELRYAFSIYYIAKRDGKYGIINLNNEITIPFEYINMYYLNEEAILVADKTETETVVFDSNLAQKFVGVISEINRQSGYIRVYTNDNYKYYNFKFEEKNSSDVLTKNTIYLSKKNGKYGFVDKEGNVVVDYIYDDATEQNQYGYAAVKLNGVWGSVDKIGKRVLEPSLNLDDSIYTYFIADWHLSNSGLYYTK